jgi:hypothetical protein
MKINRNYLYRHVRDNKWNYIQVSILNNHSTKTNLKIIWKWKSFHSQLSFQILQDIFNT